MDSVVSCVSVPTVNCDELLSEAQSVSADGDLLFPASSFMMVGQALLENAYDLVSDEGSCCIVSPSRERPLKKQQQLTDCPFSQPSATSSWMSASSSCSAARSPASRSATVRTASSAVGAVSAASASVFFSLTESLIDAETRSSLAAPADASAVFGTIAHLTSAPTSEKTRAAHHSISSSLMVSHLQQQPLSSCSRVSSTIDNQTVSSSLLKKKIDESQYSDCGVSLN
jgi:hypothetical protein